MTKQEMQNIIGGRLFGRIGGGKSDLPMIICGIKPASWIEEEVAESGPCFPEALSF